jgi:CBS-domain-containing membrane protein
MKSTIKDVMSTRVIAVRQGASYKDLAAMLREQRVSAFPVLDDHNKVIGVVSESDLLTKEALEGTVPGVFTVSVTDGIVTIEGTAESTVVGRDIIEAARHVEGVVAVRDRFSHPKDT